MASVGKFGGKSRRRTIFWKALGGKYVSCREVLFGNRSHVVRGLLDLVSLILGRFGTPFRIGSLVSLEF